MNGTVATELRQPTAPAPAPPTGRKRSFRDAAAAFWLDVLFRLAGSPRLTRLVKPLGIGFAYRFSRAIRNATQLNARRIFGPELTPRRQKQYTRGVLSHFYDFVCDVGRSLNLTTEELRAQIAAADGEENYFAAKAMRKGIIIATAHMGSFEAGAAALIDREHAMHVVFKRDPTRFEQVRSSLRRRLGVIEAPVDDGWMLWLRLREALQRDEVVMLQADRVMPGQKGCGVPFLHGHLLLPTSPVKLALASGAPIVPVFAIHAPDGRIRIQIEPAIVVEPSDAEPHPALLQFAAVLAKYVQAYPEQWLLFHPAFCEDCA